MIESEGVTGDTGDSPWCESHTYCFSQETDETTPNNTSYALVRAKATGQAIKSVNDGENIGTVILSDSKDDYQPKPWQSISCQIDGWYVYWKLDNSSGCLTAFWDNWVESDGIYKSCICKDPEKISPTATGTVQKPKANETNFNYPHQFYYETTNSETMSCYFSIMVPIFIFSTRMVVSLRQNHR